MSEENSFTFSKHLPNFGLVSKCMTAAKTQNYTGLTRSDFDFALDSVSKAIAEQEGVSFEDAYAALMEGPQGALLYQGREACPPIGTGAAVQKTEVSKVEEQERCAVRFAEAYNVSLPEARAAVKDYYSAQ